MAPMITKRIQITGRRNKRVRSMLSSDARGARPLHP
jgi:hypothetical protein